MVKNPPDKAGDMGSIPGLGNIPHAEGQLSPCPTTTEPACPRACAPQLEKPPQLEARSLQLESFPHLLQVEKACTQQ